MLTKVGTVFAEVISWIGDIVTALTGEAGALAPLFEFLLIGVVCSAILFGIKVVKSLIWGA